MSVINLVVAPNAIAGTGSAFSADKRPAVGGFKHLVVIYEENHSFDNLYGSWGKGR